MYLRKVFRLLGLVLASLMLVTVVVSASGTLLSASFAQEQNLTSKMKGNEDVVGVHSPEFGSEDNIASMNSDVQRSEITNPASAEGTVENQTVTTMKLNTTEFQHIDKSQFKKAPEFAQISDYINTPNNNSQLHFHLLKEK